MARKIKPELVEYLDEKLKGNGLAQEAIKAKDARTVMIEAAKACVGIKEATGHNDGHLVELIQATAGGKRGYSWCMYFVQSMIAYAEVKTGVKSKLPSGGHCTSIWRAADKGLRVSGTPLAGAVIIWQHGKGPSGHTGFVLSAGDSTMQTVEGNTSGSTKAGGVDRNGNGCYFNKRSRKGSGSMKILGFLRPF